jgi:hypothetical protein
MGRISRHFDKISGKQTLNSAILWIALWSICIGLGIGMILKYVKNGDNGGLLVGIMFAVMSLFNTLTGMQIAHAVVRRLLAQAQQKP